MSLSHRGVWPPTAHSPPSFSPSSPSSERPPSSASVWRSSTIRSPSSASSKSANLSPPRFFSLYWPFSPSTWEADDAHHTHHDERAPLMPTGTPAPPVFDGVADVIAVLVLLAEFGMLRAALLPAQIRLYAGQSLLLAVLAAIAAQQRGVPDLYALAVLSAVLKVLAVPAVLRRMLRDTGTDIAGSGVLGVATRTLGALLVTTFGFFATAGLPIRAAVLPRTALSLAVAAVLVAFILMIFRRDVVSQAVGFFSMENAVSLASLVIAATMPFLLEVDLLFAVVVFSALIRIHHNRRQSLSTRELSGLRG